MSIGASIFIIAVGAILRYATNINVQGVDFDTVGLILMIAGAAGLVLSALYELVWAKRRREDERLAAERRAAYQRQQAYQQGYGQQQQPQQPPEQQEYREPPRY
ncbi:MAG: DUF6458 family protein [Solirubrobacterales bacterium]